MQQVLQVDSYIPFFHFVIIIFSLSFQYGVFMLIDPDVLYYAHAAYVILYMIGLNVVIHKISKVN